jgi:hypothetical protein
MNAACMSNNVMMSGKSHPYLCRVEKSTKLNRKKRAEREN